MASSTEDEDAILDLEGLLYMYDKKGNQWKELIAGSVKFLKHKKTNKVRLVMCQPDKLIAFDPTTMSFIKDAIKYRCMWHASEFINGEEKTDLLCIRFGSIENCKEFMQTFTLVKYQQGKEVNVYKNVTPEAKKKAFEAYARANASFKQKEYSIALDAYTQAIAFNPYDEKFYCNRSLCLMRLARANEALNDARICKELKPNWAKAWFRVGSSLQWLQKFDEASDAFYEGLRLEPQNQELWNACWEVAEAGIEFRANTEK